jgi:hypothetical protein
LRNCKWQFAVKKVIISIVSILFFLVMLYLLLLSVFSTTDRVHGINGTQYTFYIKDYPYKHLVAFFLITTLIVIFKKVKSDSRINSWRIVAWIIGIMCITSLSYLILAAGVGLKSDPQKLMDIAVDMHRGVFYKFNEGQYMYRYPGQVGYLLLDYFLYTLFKGNTYIIIQILNCILLVLAYVAIGKMVLLIKGKKSKYEYIIAIIYFLFIPFDLYVLMVYGVVPGFAFSIFAVYEYMKYNEAHNIKSMLLITVYIAAAIVLKENSSIFLVAILLYLLFDCVIEKNKIKPLILALMICMAPLTCKAIVNQICTDITGVTMSKGMPKTAWIMMGLEDGETPGTYSGSSVELYNDNDDNYEITDVIARRRIREELKAYRENWRKALHFFGRKTALQWNDPTFASLELLYGTTKDTSVNEFVFSREHMKVYRDLCNFIQTLLLCGGVMYVVFDRDKKWLQMFGPVLIVGGFVFHTFWEGSPRYVLPYYVLLIPYAVDGWNIFTDRITLMITEKRMDIRKSIWAVAAVGIIILACVSARKKTIFKYTIGIESDDDATAYYYKMMK